MLLLWVCNLVVKLFKGNQFSVSLKIFKLINIKMKLVFRIPPSYINFVLNLIVIIDNIAFQQTAKNVPLLINFAYSLDPDQDRQNVGPDLDSNCLVIS